jgi:hypothetical protein
MARSIILQIAIDLRFEADRQWREGNFEAHNALCDIAQHLRETRTLDELEIVYEADEPLTMGQLLAFTKLQTPIMN